MNRSLKLETIFFVSLFSLFFTLSVEANGSGSKRYRDSFSNAPDPDLEREPPVEKGKDNEKDDPGTKGGKTGKKKKKKTDISIPPGAGNEGSLVITLEAKSAQLTSFSNNGFSEPGASVILDPDSSSPISSDRSLFDQVRGDFIREGGRVFVDENGFVEGFDPSIRQTVGIKIGQFLTGGSDFADLTGSDIFFAGASRLAKGSEAIEDGGYKLALTAALQTHPVTSIISPFLAPQIYEDTSPKYIFEGARVYINSVWALGSWAGSRWIKAQAATWGFGSPELYLVLDAAPGVAIADGWRGLNFYTNPNGDGLGWAAVEAGLGTAGIGVGLGALGFSLRHLDIRTVWGRTRQFFSFDPMQHYRPILRTPRPRPDISRLTPYDISPLNHLPPTRQKEVYDFIGQVGRNNRALGEALDRWEHPVEVGDIVIGQITGEGKVLQIIKENGDFLKIVDRGLGKELVSSKGKNALDRFDGEELSRLIDEGTIEIYEITGDFIDDISGVMRTWLRGTEDDTGTVLWLLRNELLAYW